MALKVFFLSAVLHVVALCSIFVLMATPVALDVWVAGAVTLFLVAALGFSKGMLYARQHHNAYIAGVATALACFVIVVAWLMWALSHPVGEPPPMSRYVVSVLFRDGKILWLGLAVFVAMGVSIAGAEIGIRLRTRGAGS